MSNDSAKRLGDMVLEAHSQLIRSTVWDVAGISTSNVLQHKRVSEKWAENRRS